MIFNKNKKMKTQLPYRTIKKYKRTGETPAETLTRIIINKDIHPTELLKDRGVGPKCLRMIMELLGIEENFSKTRSFTREDPTLEELIAANPLD